MAIPNRTRSRFPAAWLRWMSRAFLPLGLAPWAATPSTVVARVVTHTRLDFDGDGKTDAAVTRDVAGTLVWYVQRSSDGGLSAVSWGLAKDFGYPPADTPVPADFDGDGKTDIAVRRITWKIGDPPFSSIWYILESSTDKMVAIRWGTHGTDFNGTPLDDPRSVGDFDGDGKADLSVYRHVSTLIGSNWWFIRRSSDGVLTGVEWGRHNDFYYDVPIPGDYPLLGGGVQSCRVTTTGTDVTTSPVSASRKAGR